MATRFGSYFGQLRQRNVFKVAVVYAVVAWLAIQASTIVFPNLGLPNWTVTLVIVLVVIGFPVALVLAWAYELRPVEAQAVSVEPAPGASVDPVPAASLEPAARASVESVPATAPVEQLPASPTGSASRAAADAPRVSAPQVAGDDRPSVAVLPFLNMMSDPAQEYFADGMTEDLITDLSKISGLCVIARNSTFTFKGQAVDVREAAQTLGARYVVEGSVRKLGERVRINTQLIDASTGAHIWAERYDGDLAQVFELQDEILAKIVSALQVNLKVGEKMRLQSKTTSNLEAYDLFLKGRNAFYQLDRESFVAANELLKQAVSLDPGFAAAHAYLSQARMGLALFSSSEEREAGLREALEAAEAAVACDDSLGIAHAFLGWCQIWLLRYDDAMASFERAVALAPNDAEVLGHYATALNYSGQPERAIEMFDLAIKLDPLLPPNLRFTRGVSLFLLNRREEALDEFRTVAHVAPAFHGAHMWCAAVLTELGRAEEAEAVAAKLRGLPILYTDGMVRRIPFRDKSVRERMLGSLRKAGLLD